MKTRALVVPLFAALLAAGCGQKESGASATAAAPASTSSAPAATAGAAREVDITANDQMKFVIGSKMSGPTENLTIEAKPGETLKIVLTNTGTLPKEAMGHNWVLLKAGSDAAAFSTAAATAKDTDYVPPSLKDEIYTDPDGHTARIETLGPRKSGEITFKAPAQPGDYPFLCSFPAHYAVGMKGTLVVK